MKLYLATGPDGNDWAGRHAREGQTLLAAGADNDWIDAYKQPEVAPFLNPFFEDYQGLTVWECSCTTGRLIDDGLRVRCNKLLVGKPLALPTPSPTQARRFAIVCAVCACSEPKFLQWANKWLNNEDRGDEAARLMAADLPEDEPSRDVALAALAAVLGEPECPQYQRTPQYYAAAAGWRCFANSDGKVELTPAAKFAVQEN
jgi:hypothetical protein